jgi:FAD:protein FMN transferase
MRREPARFRSMGVDVVVGGAGEAELAAIVDLVAEWDRTFSRFRPDSELSRVNASGAEALVVSPRFAEVVEIALLAARATGGLVDPTLGAAIEAAGYDRDFAGLGDDERPPAPDRPGSWRELRLSGRLLVRPPGTILDLNGVVKALVVDAALELLAGDGFVSAGGDLAVRGALSVELPAGGAVVLERGGLATSGSDRRRWLRGGEPQHHLLDPATGRPADSPWTGVTVAAGSCLSADVAAKAAFLSGAYGPEWLDLRGLAGRFTAGGRVVENRAWRAAVGTGALAA